MHALLVPLFVVLSSDPNAPIELQPVPLPEPIPCVSAAEWREMRREAERNLMLLYATGQLSPPAASRVVRFEWPLRAAASLTDPGYHSTTSYFDHDLTSPGILDPECNTRTRDSHNGIDAVLWPFWWYKMDHDEVEIVAAAAGTIIGRTDGQNDRSCTPGGTSNKISIRHEDGTMAWYLHMKNGSVTPKLVGATVQAGESLGIVGSSGNSGLPHLHFDVRDASWNSFDPYFGPCNGGVDGSWWLNQRPYNDSAINAVRTHFQPPVFPPCPQQEIPNFQEHFQPGDLVHIGIYHRDILQGHSATYTIHEPDGTVALQGSYTMNAPHYSVSYAMPTHTLPAGAPLGRWRIRVDYEGQVYRQSFVVQSHAGKGTR